MKNLTLGLGFIVIILLSVTYSGYVLSVLWEWFVVPVFNIQPISIALATGLALIVGYLTNHDSSNSEDTSSDFGEALSRFAGKAIAKPSMALLFGWMVTWFI